MESAVKKPGKRSLRRAASLSISRPSTCGYPASAWTPIAVATRIAASPAHRPNGHRGRRNGSRQELFAPRKSWR
jgi:hypothetical protein